MVRGAVKVFLFVKTAFLNLLKAEVGHAGNIGISRGARSIVFFAAMIVK